MYPRMVTHSVICVVAVSVATAAVSDSGKLYPFAKLVSAPTEKVIGVIEPRQCRRWRNSSRRSRPARA